MELLCPSCQQKLTIAEHYAGQVVRCPNCAGTFTAPALPGTQMPAVTQSEFAPLLPPDALGPEPEPPVLTIEEVPAEPPAPTPPWSGASPGTGFDLVPETAASSPAPPASLSADKPLESASIPPPLAYAKPISEATQPAPKEPPQSKAVSKEYAHGITIHLRREALAWIAPVGMISLFILSFFPWEGYSDVHSANLWQMAFSQDRYLSFLFYVLFFFLAWPFSMAALLLQKKWLPVPAELKAVLPWTPLIMAALALVPFLLFFTHYVHINFAGLSNPSTAWMKIAFRVHFLVVLGALLHFWLVRRSAKKRPDPRISMRW